MPFIKDILKHRSLAVAGMEKNTGKTECLNYILERIESKTLKIAVTSIGVDGESTDIVTSTSKPEIIIKEGIYYATAEKFFKTRELISEIVDLDYYSSAAGRVVTSLAHSAGKVILAGPSESSALKSWMNRLGRERGIEHFIVDGALSRVSQASPAICDALILATGAALSISVNTLVSKTIHLTELIKLPATESLSETKADNLPNGIYSINGSEVVTLFSGSVFNIDGESLKKIAKESSIYLCGVLSDRFIERVKCLKEINIKNLIIKDFTRIFLSPENMIWLDHIGIRLEVVKSSNLLAICVNPVSPSGYTLDSAQVCDLIAERSGIAVYDIYRLRDEIKKCY